MDFFPDREAMIVAAGRSAVGKAGRGALRNVRPDDMAAQVIRGVLGRIPTLDPALVEDVILGCAMPEAEQGLNVARISALRAGLPESSSAMTINRFCSSGLQAVALATHAVRCGGAEVILAGGTESMSLVPMEGHWFRPNPTLVDEKPDVYLSMGLTAENLADRYQIGRQDQDRFALRSHEKAVAAQQAGRFEPEIVPLEICRDSGHERTPNRKTIDFRVDEGPRSDTSEAALSELSPVFKPGGTVTAGNSSQKSDGAAAVIVASAGKVRELGLKPLGRLISFATAGVAPEIMGIGPVKAIPKALKQAGLELRDIALVELNEAFAVQALAVIQEVGLDSKIVNVNGGAVALGHPLGCTGAKLTTSLLYEMRRRGVRYGLVTLCVGGGMGAAGVVEAFSE